MPSSKPAGGVGSDIAYAISTGVSGLCTAADGDSGTLTVSADRRLPASSGMALPIMSPSPSASKKSSDSCRSSLLEAGSERSASLPTLDSALEAAAAAAAASAFRASAAWGWPQAVSHFGAPCLADSPKNSWENLG